MNNQIKSKNVEFRTVICVHSKSIEFYHVQHNESQKCINN